MAIWEKLFSKITFKNYPDTSTPINATNLNKMTDAIDGIDDRVVELNSNLEQSKPVRIATQTEIAPSGSATFNYSGLASDWSACEIMYYAYGGYRQSVKIPISSTVIKFMTSATEWGGSFTANFAGGVLTITNISDKQKVVITHIYMIP